MDCVSKISLYHNGPEHRTNQIKNYSGVSVEFRQIKAAMGEPKQQMLPSFWSDSSTAITRDFKHPIVCDFSAGLASEITKKKSRLLYSI